MAVFIFALLLCVVVASCERCVFENVQCVCSDDMGLVMCRGSCIKQIGDIKVPHREELKVRILDLQDNCLNAISSDDLTRFPNLKVLNIKNQVSFQCSSLKHRKDIRIVSDCRETTTGSSLLLMVLTSATTDISSHPVYRYSSQNDDSTTTVTTQQKFTFNR